MMTKEEDHDQRLTLSDNEYETGLKLALIVLPALGTAYFVIGSIFYWPFIKEICGILLVFLFFLGILLYLSFENNKYDGKIMIYRNPGEKVVYSLELDIGLEEIEDMDHLTFRVVDE